MAQMQLFNAEYSDFSKEGILLWAAMLECIYGAQIISARMDRAMRSLRVTGETTKRHRYINQAAKLCRQLEACLSAGYDSLFEKMYDKKPEEGAQRFNDLQFLANDIVRLLLIYLSRVDSDDAKRNKMKKALLNFKPEDATIDLEAMLRFFDFKLEE